MSSMRTITGLSFVVAVSPLQGYFATILDAHGPWTEEMLERHDDEPGGCGLFAWEGFCEVTIDDEGTDDECREYAFSGAYRSLTPAEAHELAANRRPLSGEPFPSPAFDDAGNDVRAALASSPAPHDPGCSQCKGSKKCPYCKTGHRDANGRCDACHGSERCPWCKSRDAAPADMPVA